MATLAGWLLYHGFLQRITKNTGTIAIQNDNFNALGSGNIPDIPHWVFLPGLHKITLLLGVFAIAIFVWNEISKRRKTESYGF